MVDNSVTISIVRMPFETSRKETQKYETIYDPLMTSVYLISKLVNLLIDF